MRYYCFLFCILNLWLKSKAQVITITELNHKATSNSLYSIAKLNSDTCIAVGKNGIGFYIINQNNNWQIEQIKNLPPITMLDVVGTGNKTFLATDSGYFFSKKNAEQFTSHKINSNKKLSSYCVTATNKQIIVGGMHTKIANGKKALPKGFLTVVDSNAKVFFTKKYWGSAIWDVFYNKANKAFALKYNLFGTCLLTLQTNKWKKTKHYKALLHKALLLQDSTFAFCGSNQFTRKYGVIFIQNKKFKLPQTDVVWSITQLENTIIATGSNGAIFYKNEFENVFSTIYLPEKIRTYDLVAIDKNIAIAVGQLGKIYLITKSNF